MENALAEYDSLTLDLLLDKVYRDGGYDFRDYKRGTITRRLARRLHFARAKTYSEYMQFLDAHPEEYHKLADEITIKVSSFFRSPYSFQQIARLVLPELLSYKEASGEREIRFWSVACAQGEEPYSLAMLLTEFLGIRLRDFNISIYATDMSQSVLNKAQTAVYSLNNLEGLPGTIQKSCFIPLGEDYAVRADIRQMVKFSHFDLTSNARLPLVNLDGIFCCNVLIYWQRPLQERVLNMLYGALAIPGYLVLGEAETPTRNIGEKLLCLDSRAKIYKKSA